MRDVLIDCDRLPRCGSNGEIGRPEAADYNREDYTEMRTLGEALPDEQARVRQLKTIYEGLEGGVGRPAAFLMEQSLQRADKAVMSGDVIAMMQAYEDLKGYSE